MRRTRSTGCSSQAPLLALAASRCGVGKHALDLLVGEPPVRPDAPLAVDRVHRHALPLQERLELLGAVLVEKVLPHELDRVEPVRHQVVGTGLSEDGKPSEVTVIA
jgi:hypothetical protein